MAQLCWCTWDLCKRRKSTLPSRMKYCRVKTCLVRKGSVEKTREYTIMTHCAVFGKAKVCFRLSRIYERDAQALQNQKSGMTCERNMQAHHKKLCKTGETTALEPVFLGSTNPQHTNAKKLENDSTQNWLAAACSKQQNKKQKHALRDQTDEQSHRGKGRGK